MPPPAPSTPLQQLPLFEAEPPARGPRAAAEPPPLPALAPAQFRHPQAEREITLDGHHVAYALRRARRRSIGFIVSPEGLAVTAPRWVGQGQIDEALQAKAGWILRKLREQRERSERLQARRISWREGASVPFLGDEVVLVLDPRVTGAVLHANTDGSALPGVARHTLHLGLPQDAGEAQLRDLVQSWLKRQALRVFDERCRHYAAQLGVRITRLSLTAAQTRWGSASADGSVRLHWRLVHFALPVIDYVVVHELAHLREMNHSPAFWEVVRSVQPDFEQHRRRLKDEVLPGLD
jgi:predicted metal-dependent hydrolase